MLEGQGYIRVQLSPNSEEFKKVERLFRVTMSEEKAVVIKIEGVQNADHWKKYNLKKELMRNAGLERELFHGTQPQNVQKICKENFDPRLSGENGTKYGQGSYFAVNASYSDEYAKQNESRDSRFMFLAYVLVGSYTNGDSTMKRPPPKNPRDEESDLFDSCVNDERNPTIFVIFERDQCYPAFIIEYSITPDLPPLRDKGPDPMGNLNIFHKRNSVHPLPGLHGVSNFELSRLPSNSPDLFDSTRTSSRIVLPAIPPSSLSTNALPASHMVFTSPPLASNMPSASGHMVFHSGVVPSAPPPSPPLGHVRSSGNAGSAPFTSSASDTVPPNVSSPCQCRFQNCCVVAGLVLILAAAYLILHFFVVDKAMSTKRLQL